MKTSIPTLCALALGVAAVAASPATAAGDEDLAAIRQEMKSLRGDYESKIRELERRLKKAEARADKSEAAAKNVSAAAAENPVPAQPMADALPPPPQPPAAPRAAASANAFNPAISAILNGSYTASRRDPALARVPGFVLGDEAGLADRGFSLGESEVAITASVDPYFLANLIVSLGNDDSIAVEEAYIQSTNLPWGFTAKLGRFFSGVGYLNEKHAHAWDFVDAPLPYRALLGNQYGDDGIEVRWLAPTDFFLEFGAEWYRGDSFPAGNGEDNGAGTIAAFVHSGGDIDDSSSFLAGLSFLHTKALDRDTGGDLFTGTDGLGIASLVYKWSPNGNPTVTNLVVNGEYFFGHEDGTFNGVPVDTDRSGFYVQGVYQFMPHWRFGLRYAELETDAPPALLAGSALDDFGHTPQSLSALLEYDTSEFGRFRVQYTLDDADLQTDSQITAAYTVSIGSHGAHRF
ncbi:MAG: hypothetical protein K8S25_08665 [Alphaproteobacteria bacterium]|nr:hypothetical protein [Alphaproteobacteria bacterium]